MLSEKTFFNTINTISKGEIKQNEINNFFTSATALLINASKKSNVKDNFTPYYYQPTASICCFLVSEKTKANYYLMYDFYKNEIIFHTDLLNWENIKNLNDSFWLEFLEMSQTHNFKFRSYSGPFYDKEVTPEFSANYKSFIFNLMSVYITAMLESKEERGNISFGSLEIVWTPKNEIEEVLDQLNVAFKSFYRFNYLLWKSDDIRRQNQNNRKKK
ncbi:MAG: hypothetical protein H7239_00820 [Flavobacterium sp.]|nr:hypothetical protein [Flavobacterium sp.]